jgi:hypothetical protein
VKGSFDVREANLKGMCVQADLGYKRSMRNFKRLLKLLAIGGACVLVARTAAGATDDLRHYNRLREMSDEGPIWQELPEMIREIAAKERGLPLQIAGVIAGLPADIARYIKIKTM